MIEIHGVANTHTLLMTANAEALAPLVSVIRSILQQLPTLVKPYEVMAATENGMFDLAIFDMHDSREALPLLRSFKGRFPLIPAITMVPYGDVGMIEQVIAHDADDYISQPISLERLKITLRNALRLRRLMLDTTAGSLASLRAASNGDLQDMSALIDRMGKLKPLREIEDAVIAHAIAACDGCITQAAQALGIGRSTLYRKIHERSQVTPRRAV